MTGMQFPHNLLVPLLAVTGFVLNVLNLITFYCSRNKLNVIQYLQIIKTCFVLAAFVICVPLGAELYKGGESGYIIFRAVKDILDMLLIHSKPTAFAVISVFRYRFTKCRGVARNMITRQCGLVAMAISMVPLLLMVICRIVLAVYDIHLVQNYKENRENTSNCTIFHAVRLWALDAMPLLLGVSVIIAVQRAITKTTCRVHNRLSAAVGQLCGVDMAVDPMRTSSSITRLHRPPTPRNSTFAPPNSLASGLRRRSSIVSSSIIVILVSAIFSWSIYIIIDFLLLVDFSQLPKCCLLYGQIAVLFFDPIGDGLFCQTKRKRLIACWYKCFSNSISHHHGLEITGSRVSMALPIVEDVTHTSYASPSAHSTHGQTQVLSMQSRRLSICLLNGSDGKTFLKRLSRQESISKISFCGDLSSNCDLSTDEFIEEELTGIDGSASEIEMLDLSTRSKYTGSLTSASSSTLKTPEYLYDLLMASRNGAKCPSPTMSTPRPLSSEGSCMFNSSETQSNCCTQVSSYISTEQGSEHTIRRRLSNVSQTRRMGDAKCGRI